MSHYEHNFDDSSRTTASVPNTLSISDQFGNWRRVDVRMIGVVDKCSEAAALSRRAGGFVKSGRQIVAHGLLGCHGYGGGVLRTRRHHKFQSSLSSVQYSTLHQLTKRKKKSRFSNHKRRNVTKPCVFRNHSVRLFNRPGLLKPNVKISPN